MSKTVSVGITGEMIVNGSNADTVNLHMDEDAARRLADEIYRQLGIESAERDAGQLMFERCVNATCPFCNYGAPLGADKKYHTQPMAECSAYYLHQHFPDESKVMIEKQSKSKAR